MVGSGFRIRALRSCTVCVRYGPYAVLYDLSLHIRLQTYPKPNLHHTFDHALDTLLPTAHRARSGSHPARGAAPKLRALTFETEVENRELARSGLADLGAALDGGGDLEAEDAEGGAPDHVLLHAEREDGRGAERRLEAVVARRVDEVGPQEVDADEDADGGDDERRDVADDAAERVDADEEGARRRGDVARAAACVGLESHRVGRRRRTSPKSISCCAPPEWSKQ